MKRPFRERLKESWQVLTDQEVPSPNQDLLDEIQEMKSETERMKLLMEFEEVSKTFSDFGTFMNEKNEFAHRLRRVLDKLDIEKLFECTSKIEREEIIEGFKDGIADINKSTEWQVKHRAKDTPINRFTAIRKEWWR